MSDLTTFKSVSIQDYMARLAQNKYNPSSIQQAVFNHLDEITEGQVNVVDPTNPFVFLLESSAVNTALAIQENTVNLRKQYPSLAQVEDDLYMHMSDKDYLNRFSTPAQTEFTIVVSLQDILDKMVYSTQDQAFKATIPRDTYFEIDGHVFTLQYPIDIRKYNNGIVLISYDASIASPIDGLETNIIQPKVRRASDGTSQVFIPVKVKQFAIESTNHALQQSTYFNVRVPFTDQFYFIRAFYRNSTTQNAWKEFKTTHTDQVFDPSKATALVKVYTGEVEISIPSVYLTTGLISGEVRFDIYTTKGNITVNMSNYRLNSFAMTNRAIDEVRDTNVHTTAFAQLSYFAYCDKIVSGGTDGISFEELRERVITNTVGQIVLPITPNQIETFVNNTGFNLVKNVDAVTNRIFLATRKLPKPLNTRLITSANIGISTYLSTVEYLKTLTSVKDNGRRVTLMSKNLFFSDNGIVTLVPPAQVDTLLALPKNTLVNLVNDRHYLYNPFYYVLDNSDDEFELRAYNLDYPLASNLNFVSQNQSIQLPVNTGQYSLVKIAQGYKFRLVTQSGNFYKLLSDGLVGVQIGYTPNGENRMAYINGTMVGKTDTDERIFEFIIETNHDINSDHELSINNARMFGNETVDTWVNLDFKINIFYWTTSLVNGFIGDAADALLGKFILPNNAVAITREMLDFQVGTALKNLWTRSRSLASGADYLRYQTDIPLMYEQDVFEFNPDTQSIFSFDQAGNISYNKQHNAGDPVLDNEGNQLYKHRAGDVVMQNGQPVIVDDVTITKEMDILFVDGRHFFVNDVAFLDYNNELVGILDEWITESLKDIQERLLEQTRIFFYPETTLGIANVFGENATTDDIIAEQSLILDLYVRRDVYNDSAIRQELSDTAVRLLDGFIGQKTVNATEIVLALKDTFKDSVISVEFSGLGGSKNYRYIRLSNEQNRLCLKKILALQADNSIIVKEDVTVNFYEVS